MIDPLDRVRRLAQVIGSRPCTGEASAPSGARGQSLVEFALIAPIIMVILAIVFTGSQYMNALVGLDSAARAGALTVAADTSANVTNINILTDDAVLAVNREQGVRQCPGRGAPPCFVASTTGPAGCPANSNCVWVDNLINPNPGHRSIEIVHVAYTIRSYLVFIPTTAVSAQAGAE